MLRVETFLKRIDVVLVNKEGAEQAAYLLELTGSQRQIYQTKMLKRFNVGDAGIKSIKDLRGMQEDLLSVCLYDAVTDQLLPTDTIEKLPSTAQTQLFEAAQELSALVEAKKASQNGEEEGND